MQLAIDTSTANAGLALMRESEVIAEISWRCGLNHTVELYPHLDFLLSSHNASMKDLDCVYVAKGPGSFNGLRVGVSAAKGLAFSLGISIIAIGTLEVEAYQCSAGCETPICSLQNAGREELAAAVFQNKPRKGWTRLADEQLVKPADLKNIIKERTLFCGEFDTDTALLVKKALKSRAYFASPASRVRRAAFLAELGLKRKQDQDFDSVSALQPLYLRRPPITERKKP